MGYQDILHLCYQIGRNIKNRVVSSSARHNSSGNLYEKSLIGYANIIDEFNYKYRGRDHIYVVFHI